MKQLALGILVGVLFSTVLPLAAQQAFPTAGVGQHYPPIPGMTLRQYYAGQALAGLTSNYNPQLADNRRAEIVSLSVKFADDMVTKTKPTYKVIE